MRERIPCPPTGVYPGIPAAEYHAWDAASKSGLRLLAGRTAAHAHYDLHHPKAQAEAQVRGDALHAAVLEPALFAASFVAAEPCAALLKSGERKGNPCGAAGKFRTGGEWFCDKHRTSDPDGAEQDASVILPPAEYASVIGMRDAVLNHPDAAPLVAACDQREVSVVFYWPGNNVLCKARFDLWSTRHGIVADLKSTLDASEAGFNRTVDRFYYHWQDEFYRTAAQESGFPVRDFFFIPVESRPHHGVDVHQLDDTWRSIARNELAAALDLWRTCTTSGRWPSYPTGVKTLSPPAWRIAGGAPVLEYTDEDFQ